MLEGKPLTEAVSARQNLSFKPQVGRSSRVFGPQRANTQLAELQRPPWWSGCRSPGARVLQRRGGGGGFGGGALKTVGISFRCLFHQPETVASCWKDSLLPAEMRMSRSPFCFLRNWGILLPEEVGPLCEGSVIRLSFKDLKQIVPPLRGGVTSFSSGAPIIL